MTVFVVQEDHSQGTSVVGVFNSETAARACVADGENAGRMFWFSDWQVSD